MTSERVLTPWQVPPPGAGRRPCRRPPQTGCCRIRYQTRVAHVTAASSSAPMSEAWLLGRGSPSMSFVTGLAGRPCPRPGNRGDPQEAGAGRVEGNEGGVGANRAAMPPP